MSERMLMVGDVQVPRFLYGTAWKEDATQRLTILALEQGFRGIDTANQRRHYDEAAVGRAVQASLESGLVSRDQLFLQSKFTFRSGQDHRLPYDPAAPIAEQVRQSFASSRKHLGVESIDSYLLHGPSTRAGLSAEDWAAWRAMEEINESGAAHLIGVSNFTLEQLELLCRQARVRPSFVQNRCYAVLGWDKQVRDFCAANGIAYQGFSLLTANREVLMHPVMANIARRYSRTVNQIVFRFALDVGMIPLTGTTNAEHMREDLTVFDFELDTEDVQRIEAIAVGQ